MSKIFLLLLFSNVLYPWSYSQNISEGERDKKMDSLKRALNLAQEDTTRIRIYLELGDVCELKDNLIYAEPALVLIDKLLIQTSDKKIIKRLLQQKVSAHLLTTYFYSSTNPPDWDKAISSIDEVLKISTEIDDKQGTAQALAFKSGMYIRKNDTAKFLDAYQQSIAIYREIKDMVSIIESYINLSAYYVSIKNYPKALQSTQSGLSIAKELGYKKGMALCLVQMADIYRDEGENIQALENYQSSLAILKEIKDTGDLVNVIAAMGGFYYKNREVAKSLESYQEVISIYEARKWNDKIPRVYMWIGDMYQDNHDYPNALINYQKSLSMYESTTEKDKVGEVLDKIGKVYNADGYPDKALEFHYKSLKIADGIKNEYGMAWTQYYLAEVYRNQKNYRAAKQFCELSLSYRKKQLNIKEISDAELLASQIDSALGNGQEAYNHYKQYALLNDQLKNEAVHNAAQKEKFDNEFALQKAMAETILKQEQTKRYGLYGGLSVLMIFGGFMYNRFRVTQKQKLVIETQKDTVEKEKQRSEQLLLNILPAEIAEELKQKGSADARHFDKVTVMFTDFKNFTQISEKLSPAELVATIHTCFMAFDQIISKHHIEKIKTIGDAYMCAGGLPIPNTTHAKDVVLAALEIQQYMNEYANKRKEEGKEIFEIRIGIHTGPVVAGIVGIKKFAYDMWGDTVNTASRMESSGEEGKINISGTTYALISNQFQCTYRGKILAKNKGDIDMYFVEG